MYVDPIQALLFAVVKIYAFVFGLVWWGMNASFSKKKELTRKYCQNK
jgi:hypothetical protein